MTSDQIGETRARRARRVKTGCRTCRIRKIKCDETRPACSKCTSTGRTCDWYGDSRGVGVQHRACTSSTLSHRAIVPSCLVSMVHGVLEANERHSLEWLVQRTVPKVTGLFTSEFWQRVVPQACAGEQVVFRAALALASAHESAVRLPGKERQFTIRQYSRAISHLVPILSTRDESSVRVALIACLMFACIEFVQKRYKTGQTHLQNGHRVLREALGCEVSRQDVKPTSNLVDGWLVEAFERLSLQSSLLDNQWSQISFEEDIPVPAAFQSANQARRSLDGLLKRTYSLTRFRRRPPGRSKQSSDQHFIATRRQIQMKLSMWLQATMSSSLGLSGHEAISYQLLHIYHTMAHILVGVAVIPPDEMLFERYNRQFASMIAQVKGLLEATAPMAAADTTANMSSADFSFTIDMGIIPPLYFIAIKCRVPTIRREAIDLLTHASYQEGMWHGAAAATAATEIVRLEEQAFAKTESLLLAENSEAAYMVPGAFRLYGVSVEMPDMPDGKLLLTTHRRRSNGSWQASARQLDIFPKVRDG